MTTPAVRKTAIMSGIRQGVKVAALALALGACAADGPAPAEQPGPPAVKRSKQARASFARMFPCPATRKPAGACPGYVVDHIVPLCAGGPDQPSNMQWQTVESAKLKDAEERKTCRTITRPTGN